MWVLYKILAGIDWIVYWLASGLFRIIFTISQREFFIGFQIEEFQTRVYIILGVLMLFKVVISAIQYLVNPDSFDDKDKGAAGLLKKVVITFALIAITPTLFDFAKDVEGAILEQLPAIVLGSDAPAVTDDSYIGNKISYTILASFVSQRKDVEGAGVGGYGDEKPIHNLETFVEHVTDGCPPMFGWFVGSQDDCVYNYMIIVSTAAGIFLCYVLLSMTLDVAIRTIKFGIIKMLAPIPISSYIFSKDKLTKFWKTALQVYTDLFIRLIIVYFIIFAIQSLIAAKIIDVFEISGVHGSANVGEWFLNVITNVALIFGLLIFAKKAPKFVTDLLGLPEVTGGDMADMFKPAWRRIGGLAAPGAAIGAYRNAIDYGEKPGRAFRRALTAGGHAVISRLKDVASGKDFAETYKTSKEAAMARTNRNLEYANRYPNRRERRHQIRKERWDAYTGVTTGGQRASATIDAANKAISTRSDIWSRAEEKVLEVSGRDYTSTVQATYSDSHGSHTQTYTLSQLLTRLNDLEHGTATPIWSGEKEWLMQHKQESIDAAKIEFIQKSLSGDGDGKARNKFAEDIFAFMRSGGDTAEIDAILHQTVEDVIDPSTGRNVGNVQLDLAWAANAIARGDSINGVTAAALAKYIQGYKGSDGKRHGIETDAGSMRVRATQTQTSEPKSS